MDEGNKDGIWEVVENSEAGRSPFAVRVLVEGMEVTTVRLDPKVTYIGRMPENHIVLDDPKVSRSHACITNKDGKYHLEDQESENGIYVKGKRVPETVLEIGSKVVIGSHILEVISAEEVNARSAEREANIEDSGEEEWRNDSTLSGATVDLDALRERMRIEAEKKAAAKEAETSVSKDPPKPQTMKAPKLTLQLEIGDRQIQKEIRFEKGKKREGAQKDEIWVKIGVGNWVLEKKVDLT